MLITLTSRLIVLSADGDGVLSTSAALGIAVLTILVSLALARWTLPIEGWARSVNAWLLNTLWREEESAAGRPQR